MEILFNENSLITDTIMEALTIHIILYMRDYYGQVCGAEFSKQFLMRFKDYSKNFFELIGNHLSSVLKSLGSLLSNEMDSVNIDQTVDAIRLIEFSISELPIC